MQGYDKAVDMWGIGMLMFIMLFGFNPFERESNQQTHNAILRCKYHFPPTTTVSEEARDMIRKLLVVDPKLRLTAEECLSHQWLDPHTPASPQVLMVEKRPVKQALTEFNARRAMKNMVKSAHRRIGTNSSGLANPPPKSNQSISWASNSNPAMSEML